MTYRSFYRQCAFCPNGGSSLIKYSTRRYAHAECLLRAKGLGFINKLPLCSRKQALAAITPTRRSPC